MKDYSLDLQSEKIYSSKTKEYFDEVIKSYYSESYRSAIVMLYSIVITDLVYKIEELKELYEDNNAIEILSEITDSQSRNPNSPDWETKLIDLVKHKTNLLEPSDHLHLITLQKHRHLCAHPVLTQNSDLYRPNKETTRAHIRNMLEGVLTKPPLLSRKIFEEILTNLKSIKTIIYDESHLEIHLKTKYLNKVNLKTIKHIFRSLWKITFKINNPSCDENREINYKALIIILRNYQQNLLELITSEKDYYSDISVINLPTFIRFLNQFPEIFAKLNESTKILTKNTIELDADLETSAIFLTNSIEDHIDKILEINWNSKYTNLYITSQSILEVFKYTISNGKRDLAYNFIIKMFGNSSGYDTADNRFENIINPNLKNLNRTELTMLVNEININSQIYDRRNSRGSNTLIRNRINEIFKNFDFSIYPNFK